MKSFRQFLEQRSINRAVLVNMCKWRIRKTRLTGWYFRTASCQTYLPDMSLYHAVNFLPKMSILVFVPDWLIKNLYVKIPFQKKKNNKKTETLI